MMIDRCHNGRSKDCARYGGRGIVVCQRWRASFDAFLADMGRRPAAVLSIDRIDNDKGYEPGNCRWATDSEQARNRRSNLLLTHRGETLPLIVWAQRTGIGRATIAHRVKAGWPVDEALTRPANKGNAWTRGSRS